MTVASLWKAIDNGGSGRPIRSANFVSSIQATRNPPNTIDAPTLAVDLSIWICEGLTAYGMADQHTNPSLYLVFTRTMKLLLLGVRVIFVAEGKQRTEKGTRKRRSGTPFWKATNSCVEMLDLLGVPVVRAKCEGEALCALLNKRGIVDGVISNDGDCLPFGAKVIYTKFSNENLEQGRVIQYTSESLVAVVDATDDKDVPRSEQGTVALGRQDLISFAILTGSDVAGSGLPKVGYQKAVRFIRKCHVDHPLSKATASIDELQSWARAATGSSTDHQCDAINQKAAGKCCSGCGHVGSKRNHLKHGCETCGTKPGEQCYLMTGEDRFRKSLRNKALALDQPFNPSEIIEVYMRPNDNQIPLTLASGIPPHFTPRLYDILKSKLVVKGRCLEASRGFVRQQTLRVLSRLEVHRPRVDSSVQQQGQILRETPTPSKINKLLTKSEIPCYEVVWVVKASFTDEEGEGVDGYEYITVEEKNLVDVKYPELVAQFQAEEKENAKQGDAMQQVRRQFLEKFLSVKCRDDKDGMNGKKRKTRAAKVRDNYFGRDDLAHMKKPSNKRRNRLEGDDVANLVRFSRNRGLFSPARNEEPDKSVVKDQEYSPCCVREASYIETPAEEEHQHLFCQLGGMQVEITPIESNRGVYPPKHIFVHEGEEEG